MTDRRELVELVARAHWAASGPAKDWDGLSDRLKASCIDGAVTLLDAMKRVGLTVVKRDG